MIRINNLNSCGSVLQVLLDNLVSAVLLVDKDKKIFGANNSFLKLLHSPDDDIPGQTCNGLSGCSVCKLRDSLVDPLIHEVPVKRMRLTRRFIVNRQEVVKYFIYSSQYVEVHGEKMILIVLDDITDDMDAHLKLKRMEITDGMTQMYNHKYLYGKLDDEFTRARRYGNHLSAIMLDIDNFKAINDRFGHQAGDNVLIKVSRVIKSNMREVDMAGRYENVFFLGILPHTVLEHAFMTADRIRLAVERLSFDDENLKVTISGGAVQLSKKDQGPLFLLDRLEKLLYQSKANGRNRIEQ